MTTATVIKKPIKHGGYYIYPKCEDRCEIWHKGEACTCVRCILCGFIYEVTLELEPDYCTHYIKENSD